MQPNIRSSTHDVILKKKRWVMRRQSQWTVLNGAKLVNILHVVLYQNFEFKFAILCYEKATHPKKNYL